MKLETILQAAVNSMIHGHHAPHCFSAHVPGAGYINDGKQFGLHEDYKRQLERAAQSEIDNMGYAPHYSEPGYDQPAKGVLLANWNSLPREIDTILERAGYTVEWSDEWMQCDDCQGLIRTSPDSYSWRKSYVVYGDCTPICSACVLKDLDAYEEHLLNKSSIADTLDVDWSGRGFTRFNKDSYENGFHPGQNDKPADIVKLLPSDHDYLFAIPSVGQFDISFDCWIKPSAA